MFVNRIVALAVSAACLVTATSLAHFEELVGSYYDAVANEPHLLRRHVAHHNAGFTLISLLTVTEQACSDSGAPCKGIRTLKEHMDNVMRHNKRSAEFDIVLFEGSSEFSPALASLTEQVQNYKRTDLELLEEVQEGIRKEKRLVSALRDLLAEMCAESYVEDDGQNQLVARVEQALKVSWNNEDAGTGEVHPTVPSDIVAAATLASSELDAMDFKSLKSALQALLRLIQSHIKYSQGVSLQLTNSIELRIRSFDPELTVLDRTTHAFAIEQQDPTCVKALLVQERTTVRACIDFIRDHYLGMLPQSFLYPFLEKLKNPQMTRQMREIMALTHVVNHAISERVHRDERSVATLVRDNRATWDSLANTLALWKAALERKASSMPEIPNLVDIVNYCLVGVSVEFADMRLLGGLVAKLGKL